LGLSAVLCFAALLAGCEKKISAVCEEKCKSTADVQTCQDATSKAEATAEERGCESEFESYAACLDMNAACTAGTLDATSACAAEIKALADCEK
jgi:hypothetical protein